MNTTLVRESAKVIQFPVRSRTAAGERGEGAEGAVVSLAAFVSAKAVKASKVAPQSLPRVVSIGNAWYHDEAIADDRARKN